MMLRGRSLLVLAVLLCAVPYLGLRLYLGTSFHDTESPIGAPSALVLIALAILGGLLPVAGLVLIVSRLVQDRMHYRIGVLIEGYAALILVFASWFALLQVGGVEPSFSGVPIMWNPAGVTTLAEHVTRLHEIFLNCLYLSITTITTVGFGDVVPVSPGAKALASVEMLIGIGYMGLALGHYFSVVRSR